MIKFQFYWPAWWQLWPHYESDIVTDEDYGFSFKQWVFAFGPLQWGKFTPSMKEGINAKARSVIS